MNKIYEFNAKIYAVEDVDGAYIKVPFNAKEVFGKGRVSVHATFDGEPYDGQVVNMGVKNADGSICYIIGVKKSIRKKIGKAQGDTVFVTLQEKDK